ncbi:MAG: hypothetical protein QUT27_02390, partial [candidate division Zixibacteria bacterium]|nr:hypothetical protein [candidate division Zixibacteria bacterium]
MIDSVSGAFSWTPTEAQGPDDYTFIVKVCDSGSPSLCDQEEITVHVTSAVPGVVLDGVVSTGTGAANATSVSVSHTTGSGTDRLMLVGISWNCGNTDRTISSVTFTPSSGSAVALTEIHTAKTQGQYCYSAIYSLLNPPANTAGTITVSFSGAVEYGSVVGAVNFAGVNLANPFGTAVGEGPSEKSTSSSVTLTGLGGTELVFANIFVGGGSTQTLTNGSGQSELWKANSSSANGAGNTKQAAGSSASLNWTAGTTAYWAIAAVPINPAVNSTTYTITATAGEHGSITPSGSVSVEYGADQTFAINAATGYHVAAVLVDGEPVGAVNTYTFEDVAANHTIAASFAINTYTIAASA